MAVKLSVLDLSPVPEGSTLADALNNSRDLGGHAERLGFERYWLAEHHNMPGIASAATAVAIAHVAGGTSTIRVGAGGIMLPNHAPSRHRRAVRDSRVTVSRTHRPRHRPRTWHRPHDLLCPAP